MKKINLIKTLIIGLFILTSINKTNSMLFDEEVMASSVSSKVLSFELFADSLRGEYSPKAIKRWDLIKLHIEKLWKTHPFDVLVQTITAFTDLYDEISQDDDIKPYLLSLLKQLSVIDILRLNFRNAQELIDELVININGIPEDISKKIFSYQSQWKEFCHCIARFSKRVSITDDEKEEFISLFQYLLGKNSAIERKNIFVYLTKEDLNNLQVLKKIVENNNIVFNLGLEKDQMITYLISTLNLDDAQKLFNYFATRLIMYQSSNGSLTRFVKNTKENAEIINLFRILSKSKHKKKINTTPIQNKILMDLNHIISIPEDTHRISGLHIWPKGTTELTKDIETQYKGKKFALHVDLTVSPEKMKSTSPTKKYKGVEVCELLYNKAEITASEASEVEQEELLRICDAERKTSTIFPNEFYLDSSTDLLFNCFEYILDNPKAQNQKNNSFQIIGSYKFKTLKDQIKKIQVSLCVSYDHINGFLPILCTAYPIVGFKELPVFKIKTGEKIEIVSSDDDKQICQRIKNAIIHDIVAKLDASKNLKQNLKEIKPIDNKILFGQIFDLNKKEMQSICDELTTNMDELPTQTCNLLAKYGWEESKLKRVVEFIRTNLKAEPIIEYYIHIKKSKSEQIVSATFNAIILNTDKFETQYQYIKNILSSSLYLHVTEKEIEKEDIKQDMQNLISDIIETNIR